MLFIIGLSIVALLALPENARAQHFAPVDKGSTIQFSIPYNKAKLAGAFNHIKGKITFDPAHLEQASFDVTVDAMSLVTGDKDNDAQLKSSSFFNVAKFPSVHFKSTSVTQDRPGSIVFVVNGNLTIKGITKPITLDVEFNGINKDPYGNDKAGFDFKAVINRSEYQLNWNVPLETGGLLVSNDVKIFGGVQLAKQKEA